MSVLVKKNAGITGGSPLDKGVGDVNSMVLFLPLNLLRVSMQVMSILLDPITRYMAP